MESPCLFQLCPTEGKAGTPNQLINLSSSFSNNKLSNFKFFKTATSQKSNTSFLSHKKNRDMGETTQVFNHLSTTSESKTFKLNLINHDILHSYNQRQLSSLPTSKDTYSFKRNSLNNSSLADIFPSSVKKNLMTKLDHHSTISVKKVKSKVLFSTTGPEEDLEKLVDYIISSTKKYSKPQKEEMVLMNKKSNGNDENKDLNRAKSCKCKKVGCSKYLCNCLRNGIKCSQSCNCTNCINK